MKRIMFGNFRLGFENKGNKKAYCEILDIKENTKFTIDIENGKAYIHNAGQKVSKQETFMKALKRLYDMYDKEYNHKEVA